MKTGGKKPVVLPSWEEARRAGRRVYFNYTPLIPRALSLSLSSSFPTFTRSLARQKRPLSGWNGWLFSRKQPPLFSLGTSAHRTLFLGKKRSFGPSLVAGMGDLFLPTRTRVLCARFVTSMSLTPRAPIWSNLFIFMRVLLP